MIKSQEILRAFDLSGKTALVTGACYGIGFAIATALHGAGAKVAFCATSEASVEKALAAYAAEGITDVRGWKADVTDEQQVAALIKKVESAFGPVDILVNNAGIIKRTPMLETPVEDYRRVIDVDLVAPFIVAKAVLPGMIARGHGKIINVASVLSELGRETVEAYSAAKGGLKLLTQSICAEFGGANIQCNAIAPGYIATQQTAPLRERQSDGSRHPFDAFITARTPAGRWGDAGDLMGPAVFLASSASNFVNGHLLLVDGGLVSYLGRQA